MLSPDGTAEFGQMNGPYIWNHGHLEISGLTPGTYRITLPGATPDAPQAVSLLHVTAGGTLTDVGASVPEIPITIRVDGDPTVTAGQVSLTDMATGQVVNRNMLQLRGGPAGPRRNGGGGGDTATLYAPPGSYEVMVNGRDSFLTGVSAKGAEVTGRVVKIATGSPELVVHMAGGLATVEGKASYLGKPASGAMALLVPATLGDPSGIRFERRTQTDTDGGFQFANVIPGQYILLVIDHGWSVNWRDPVALRPYLLQGEPLDLAAAATVHPVVKAVSP